MGTLDVLNITEGHMEFRFDPADPAETLRAGRVVQDMLRRGYLILVKQGEQLVKASGFDPATASYVIADGPGPETASVETPEAERPKGGKRGPRRVAASGADATAVGPTAGG